jgi:DNA-binding NtrC family response regulator
MASILLIEDCVQIQNYLGTLLERLGHHTEKAATGGQALAMARETGPDLILCDLHLPGQPSGMDLIRQLRELRPDSPLVIISGYPTFEGMEEARQLGVCDFLTKPFELSFFADVVERLVGRNVLQRTEVMP